MPTVLSHPVVPLAIRLGLGADAIPKPLLLAGVLGSVLPDLDVMAYWYGIPHQSDFGHRGFTHSLGFAIFVALIGASAHRRLKTTFGKAFVFLIVATGSHGALDAFTNGGAGIALFWPWSENRYFAPFRPIKVAPIGIDFFLHGGMPVLLSELLWVWLPGIATGSMFAAFRRRIPTLETGAA
jgi:inner membrane protein